MEPKIENSFSNIVLKIINQYLLLILFLIIISTSVYTYIRYYQAIKLGNYISFEFYSNKDLSEEDFKNIIGSEELKSSLIIEFMGRKIYSLILSKLQRGRFIINKNDLYNLITNHIALHKSMNVAMIIGGSPNIPTQEIPFCKTTDIVPTLLDLLGETPHKSVVGKSLLK